MRLPSDCTVEGYLVPYYFNLTSCCATLDRRIGYANPKDSQKGAVAHRYIREDAGAFTPQTLFPSLHGVCCTTWEIEALLPLRPRMRTPLR